MAGADADAGRQQGGAREANGKAVLREPGEKAVVRRFVAERRVNDDSLWGNLCELILQNQIGEKRGRG